MNTLKKKIVEKCEQMGITLSELASRAGFSEQTLYNIFNRGDGKLSHIKDIASVLGVSVVWLLEEQSGEAPVVNKEVRSGYIDATKYYKLLEKYNGLLEKENISLAKEKV